MFLYGAVFLEPIILSKKPQDDDIDLRVPQSFLLKRT